MNRLTHLSLFSGIGGLDLAATWAGFETVAMVEKNEFCRKVLAKNFPGVPIYDDVETFDPEPFRGRIAVVSGGFPCQDVSQANPERTGLNGERSGLWREMLRIVRCVRPLYVVAENVPNLRNHGADRVLCDLGAAGYSAGAFVVGSEDVGAPHKRQRVFIVAERQDVADADREGQLQPNRGIGDKRGWVGDSREGAGWVSLPQSRMDAHADGISSGLVGTRWPAGRGCEQYDYEPARICRPGSIPGREAMMKACGNAVNPHQAYPFFAAIAERLTAK